MTTTSFFLTRWRTPYCEAEPRRCPPPWIHITTGRPSLPSGSWNMITNYLRYVVLINLLYYHSCQLNICLTSCSIRGHAKNLSLKTSIAYLTVASSSLLTSDTDGETDLVARRPTWRENFLGRVKLTLTSELFIHVQSVFVCNIVPYIWNTSFFHKYSLESTVYHTQQTNKHFTWTKMSVIIYHVRDWLSLS